MIFKRQSCAPILCMSPMAAVIVHHIVTLKSCTLLIFLFLLLKPLLHLHPVRLISKDLWEIGQLQHGESLHMCGFELSTLSLWLSRRENVSWKPETSALLLIIFDEQTGMYSFLLGHMLHNSFHWKLFYTLWKKTLLPSQEHGR